MEPEAPILILTGAGISAESGLATFRGGGGLWEGHRVEDVATPEAFARNPALVQRFYNLRRAQLRDPAIRPNAAHRALAKLEATWPGPVTLVTQNIDDLHERAGHRDVVHMHGALNQAACTACDAETSWLGDLDESSRCPACAAVGALRPAVVWFGEIPQHLDRIARELAACELFVAIGTSGVVYPAAGFVAEVRAHGLAHTLEINLEPSSVHSVFHEGRQGAASTLVPAWVDELLARVG
ncbi:MAG: NAD-dependent deacylase [Geminicoccaceae bacterium]|nr:MAG: NAD-dependent deacylase [Geminicoccaceae bacterium]